MKELPSNVLRFATAKERQYYNAIKQHGSCRKAAKALGVNKETVTRAIKRIEKRAALSGVSRAGDVSEHVPPHHFEKGRSTFVSKDGSVSRWIKTDTAKVDLVENVRAALEAVCAA
jgi:DNA-binding transcriptional MocR family regulator